MNEGEYARGWEDAVDVMVKVAEHHLAGSKPDVWAFKQALQEMQTAVRERKVGLLIGPGSIFDGLLIPLEEEIVTLRPRGS